MTDHCDQPGYYRLVRLLGKRRLLLSLLLILICSLMCLGGSLLTNVMLRPMSQQADFYKLDDSDKPTMIGAFYGLMMEQRYDLAYKALAPRATISGQHVNLVTFTRMAQNADATNGRISQITFAYLDVSIDDTPSSNTMVNSEVQISISRSNKPNYYVNITIGPEGSHWRIQTVDRL